MTTIAVLRKGTQVAIAADSRVTFGGTLGAEAGCEFDKNSAAPVRLHTIELKG